MITIVLNQDTQEKTTSNRRYDRAIDIPEDAGASDEMSRE
jgi:hypothetical protein